MSVKDIKYLHGSYQKFRQIHPSISSKYLLIEKKSSNGLASSCDPYNTVDGLLGDVELLSAA
jgi:hypothetical protein